MQAVYKEREIMQSDLAEKAYKLGFQYEQRCMGCAQCTIAALQECLGCRNDDVFRAASGFAGGTGLTTLGPCGGFTGTALVIGQLCGRERENFEDKEGTRFQAYRLTRLLVEEFTREFGSIICREVQTGVFGRSFDLNDSEQFKLFEEAGAHRDKCPDVVGRASRLGLRIILEAGLIGDTGGFGS
jgi:C_GCAxxG_C_C family probable redox protein